MQTMDTWNLAASLAVEMWMDYGPTKLPAGWRDELVSQGLGEIKPEGQVALTALGWKYEERLSRRRRGQY